MSYFNNGEQRRPKLNSTDAKLIQDLARAAVRAGSRADELTIDAVVGRFATDPRQARADAHALLQGLNNPQLWDARTDRYASPESAGQTGLVKGRDETYVRPSARPTQPIDLDSQPRTAVYYRPQQPDTVVIDRPARHR